jgi:cell division protein FtsW (lipid II flippase)
MEGLVALMLLIAVFAVIVLAIVFFLSGSDMKWVIGGGLMLGLMITLLTTPREDMRMPTPYTRSEQRTMAYLGVEQDYVVERHYNDTALWAQLCIWVYVVAGVSYFYEQKQLKKRGGGHV